MNVDCWNTLLDEATDALRTMDPERIESIDRRIEAAAKAQMPDLDLIDQLRQVREAAMYAALLWHGCLPQQGYSPAGELRQEATGAVSVTG